MYCNQCGKQLPDDAKFCHHCGSAVGTEQNQEIRFEQPEQAEASKQAETPKQDESIEQAELPKQKFKIPKPKKERPEKQTAPGDKKKLIYIAVIAVAVIAIIVGIVIAVTSHQKVLAELPDPEYYFSNVSIDEIEEVDDVKRVILRSDEDIWNLAAGYVNLLKWSGKYPVSQSDEERYSSGDYMWNFVYNNREDIKSPYFAQVEINYYCKSNGRDKYAVWITIHDTDAFDLVQNEKYEEEDAQVTTPSVDYSGIGESSDDGVGDGTEETPIADDSSSDSTSNWESDSEDDDYEVPDALDIYDNPTPCGVCNRSGDCQTCSGDGYLMSSASDEEDRNCYSCSGSGNCRSCGGDGEL